MLIDTTIIEPDQMRRLTRWGLFNCPIAVCPDSGAQLTVGDGRRRTGRPRRYFIRVPRVLLPAGHFDQTQVGTVTAFFDEDAIEKANKRLPKLLANAAAGYGRTA